MLNMGSVLETIVDGVRDLKILECIMNKTNVIMVN